MPSHLENLRARLANGPLSSRQLSEKYGLSQPTISRVLSELGNEIVRIGAARSIQYALRDALRGLPEIPVYRVDAEGRIRRLGILSPVCPNGFVMTQEDGVTRHSDGLPWWLFDMRPQGYLGRAYVARHGAELGLPQQLGEWTDTHVLRALLAHGYDVVGNLLLGDVARDRFLARPLPEAIAEEQKLNAYARLAKDAACGEIPGSSAGGEQAKFTAYAMTPDGPRHVIVKFSELEDMDDNPVSERWRDLLLAEHLALETLRDADIAAAKTRVLDNMHGGRQRFLEIERFDRAEPPHALGRRALISLTALDAEFIGDGRASWPVITRQLADSGHIRREAADTAALLWAFGTLIGNTDMHNGNLSFVSEHGRPYDLAPAYDMSPMGFAPRSGGGLPDTIPEAGIQATVRNEIWRQAAELARAYLARIGATGGFSTRFGPCITALRLHIETAEGTICRLG